MKTYQKFLRHGIRLASIGIETRNDEPLYFCTPKGASLIGWAGVDGIHYCFIRGFGEMVFAVSPMNPAPDYVHPLAKDFTDFLRLLLACGDASALEQAWMWEKAQFETFLKENPATEEQKEILAEIAEKMNLTAMEQPWEYIRSLQSSFDYSKIKYTEDYYDVDMNPAAEPAVPEWKVYFEGNFWGHQGKAHAGKEIPIGKHFAWAGHHWFIPAAYACSKGLVVDFCMRVEAEEILAFIQKWNLTQENDSCENFTQEQQIELELDNPLSLSFNPRLELNGHELRASHGCAVTYNPCLPDGMDIALEAKWAVAHYGLDTSYGWVISRDTFPWAYKRRPKLRTLSLTMEQQPVSIPGPHFTVNASGDSFCFVHPVRRTTYTLTVQELEQQTLPKHSFGSDRWLYPTHFTAMRYTLSPDASEQITVSDCADSDKPVEIMPSGDSFAPSASASIGIMVGGSNSQGNLHTACSALHFEPVQHDIAWRITFHEKRYHDDTMILL